MKKFSSALIVLVCLLILFGGADAMAQEQKMAYINLDSIVMAMPEFKNQQKNLETYGKQLRTTIENKERELQTKFAEYQEAAPNLTPKALQERQEELGKMDQELQEFQAKSQQNFAKKQEELITPLYEKAVKAVEGYAKAEGYDFVLSNQTLIYGSPPDEITGKVIARMKSGE